MHYIFLFRKISSTKYDGNRMNVIEFGNRWLVYTQTHLHTDIGYVREREQSEFNFGRRLITFRLFKCVCICCPFWWFYLTFFEIATANNLFILRLVSSLRAFGISIERNIHIFYFLFPYFARPLVCGAPRNWCRTNDRNFVENKSHFGLTFFLLFLFFLLLFAHFNTNETWLFNMLAMRFLCYANFFWFSI